ncbi:MAG: hypothetical protein MMC23_010122, partial [Stictis urceolatum]|nr:hypothetical protein [Stictis urceolata]
MLNWPATPDRVEARIVSAPKPTSSAATSTQVAVPNLANLDRRVPTTKGKSPSSLHLTEPSPASTYGETAAGDSVPPTPGETPGSSGLNRTLRTLHLIPSQDGNPLESSFVEHASVFSPSAESLGLTGETAHSSTAMNKDIDLKPNTPSACRPAKALHSPAGVHRHEQIHDSSGGTRRGGSIRDENWRTQRSVSFALPPGGTDPFFEGRAVPANTETRMADDSSYVATRSDETADVGSSSCSSLFRPREDREVIEISGDNAQAIFPPNSCVFVANLVSTLTDEQLEFSVTRTFEQFGKVYVKIKRDPRGMPYAFCQYE